LLLSFSGFTVQQRGPVTRFIQQTAASSLEGLLAEAASDAESLSSLMKGIPVSMSLIIAQLIIAFWRTSRVMQSIGGRIHQALSDHN